MYFTIYYTINDIKRMVKHIIKGTHAIVLNSATRIDDTFASDVMCCRMYAECIEDTGYWFD